MTIIQTKQEDFLTLLKQYSSNVESNLSFLPHFLSNTNEIMLLFKVPQGDIFNYFMIEIF